MNFLFQLSSALCFSYFSWWSCCPLFAQLSLPLLITMSLLTNYSASYHNIATYSTNKQLFYFKALFMFSYHSIVLVFVRRRKVENVFVVIWLLHTVFSDGCMEYLIPDCSENKSASHQICVRCDNVVVQSLHNSA